MHKSIGTVVNHFGDDLDDLREVARSRGLSHLFENQCCPFGFFRLNFYSFIIILLNLCFSQCVLVISCVLGCNQVLLHRSDLFLFFWLFSKGLK